MENKAGNALSKIQREQLSNRIIGAAIEVHKQMGAGLLESVYEVCLIEELRQREMKVASQVNIPLCYKGKSVGKDFKIDLLVENEIIVELKAVEDLNPLHEVQLLTYLRLTGKTLGLLINFNEVLLKYGIRRVVNGFN